MMEVEESRYRRYDRSVLCTVEETAQLLAIGRTSTFRLVKEGQIRSVKIGSRRLVPRVAIDEFVDELLEAS